MIYRTNHNTTGEGITWPTLSHLSPETVKPRETSQTNVTGKVLNCLTVFSKNNNVVGTLFPQEFCYHVDLKFHLITV